MPDTPPAPEPSTSLAADVAARVRATAPRATTRAAPEIALRLIRLPPRRRPGPT